MREQSILHLTRTSVSWLTRGSQPVVLRREIASDEVAVAKEAKAMLKEARTKAGACTLALGESLYERRQLDLPSGLFGRELSQVLSRKADAMVGNQGKAVFHAIPLHGNRKSRSEGRSAWLLFAIGSESLIAMVDELRKAGFRVKRVVAAEVAYHGNLNIPKFEETEAVIQIGQLESGIGVSLFSNNGLVSQNVIPTGVLSRESMASALVQELRSMDSYWRQISEGGSVAHAVLTGFDQSYSDQVTPASQMILPNVEFHFDQDLPAVDSELEQLTRMLYNCNKSSPLATEFTLVPPPNKVLTTTLVGASIACAITLGDLGQAELKTLTGSLEGALSMRREKVAAMDRTESIHADIESMQAIEDDYDAEWQAFLGTANTGIPYSQICADVLQAIGSDGALESLEVSDEDSYVGIHMTGVVPSGSTAAAASLDAIRERLILAGDFDSLRISPEARVPGPEVDSHLLRFTLSGKWTPGIDLNSVQESTL